MASYKEQINFIDYIAPIIKKIGNERGYKIVSPFIAMACKEGNFGQSSLARKYHNHFGMKAGKSWRGEVVNLKTMEEYTVGKLTQIVDGFRVYSDDVSGVNGFFDFISTSRYANVKTQTSPLGIVTELKRAGYMTSSTYVESIMRDYIARFDLARYDELQVVEPIKAKETTVIEYPTIKMGDTDKKLGDKYIESWQNYLITLGMYNGKADGVFGIKTYYAVRQFQEYNGLKIDGIIGTNTWKKSPAYKE